MSWENALLLLDILKSHGVMQIDIMGGEPLLMEWMPGFIRTAVRNDFSVNMSTNGSRAGVLMEIKDIASSKFTVGISLEGNAAERHNRLTGSSNFDRTIRNLRLLADHGFDPLVKTVVSAETGETLQRIVDLMGDIGVRRYFLIHMDVLSKDEALLAKSMGFTDFLAVFESLKTANPGREIFKVNASCFDRHILPPYARCAGGIFKLSLLPDGSAFPCNLFHTIGEFYLGNIFRDGFSRIWSHPKLAVFREFQGNKCPREGCLNRTDCTGGCPAHACFHHGAEDGTDIRCTGRAL